MTDTDRRTELQLSADDLDFLDRQTSGEWVMNERGREHLRRIVAEIRRYVRAAH